MTNNQPIWMEDESRIRWFGYLDAQCHLYIVDENPSSYKFGKELNRNHGQIIDKIGYNQLFEYLKDYRPEISHASNFTQQQMIDELVIQLHDNQNLFDATNGQLISTSSLHRCTNLNKLTTRRR